MHFKIIGFFLFYSFTIFSQTNDYVSIDSNSTKLYFSKSLIESAKIYGFGEPTHGTKESFLYKNEFIKYLIKSNKINAIGFEFSFIRGLLIDNAINTNKTDFMQYLEGTWQYTKSMFNLLNWIKEYNLSNNKKIHVFGFDIYTTRDLFNKYIVLADTLSNIDSISMKSFSEVIELEQNACESLSNFHENINMIDTMYRITSRFILSNNSRDSLMAKIVNWNISRYSTVLISAHNAHINKIPFVKNNFLSLGYHLDKLYKNKFITFGFILGKGSYRANDIDGVKVFNIPFFNKKNINQCFINKYENDTLISYKDFPVCKNKPKNIFIVGAGSSNNKKILKKNFIKVKEYYKSYDFFIFLKNSTASNSFLEKDKDYFLIEKPITIQPLTNHLKLIIKYKQTRTGGISRVFVKTFIDDKFKNIYKKEINNYNNGDTLIVDIEPEITNVKFGYVAINDVDIDISAIYLVLKNKRINFDLPEHIKQIKKYNSCFVVKETNSGGIRIYRINE